MRWRSFDELEWRRRRGSGGVTIIEVQVDASLNDGFAFGGAGFNDGNDSLATGRDNGNNYDIWMVFDPVPVPQGATISEAHIIFNVQNDGTSTNVVCDLKGHDTDDAIAPTTRAEFDTDLGEATAASVNWDGEDFTASTVINTPDIASIIQEIVDRAGWATGQAMQLFVDDSGSPAGAGFYDFDSFDIASGARAPILHVEYS